MMLRVKFLGGRINRFLIHLGNYFPFFKIETQLCVKYEILLAFVKIFLKFVNLF